MSDYIEREKIGLTDFEIVMCNGDYKEALKMFLDKIESIPAADVRPVVRGRWELDSDPGEPWRYVCNICGEKTKDTVMGKPRANFCPNCGADMREES